jgi:hypothetical protein
MQAPALRMVNAFQNSGVQADSFSPYGSDPDLGERCDVLTAFVGILKKSR